MKKKPVVKVPTKLRKAVRNANIELASRGLAQFTFGNASGIDRAQGLVVIKPSGVPYDELRLQDLVVTDLEGTVVQGEFRPSSDLATHLALYRAFSEIGGVVHTHSHFSTAWAQAGREIPCYGTTHADYFHGPVPVTSGLSGAEISENYEANTGMAIVRRFEGVDPMRVPAVLVVGHGSFTWGPDVMGAVEVASVLEEVARLACHTIIIKGAVMPIDTALHDKHFMRKHGPDAYYGQK